MPGGRCWVCRPRPTPFPNGGPDVAAIVGIDFDNTLVSYDELIQRAAVERGLIEAGPAEGKRAVRDRIRLGVDGEVEWQKLQALVYGPMMPQARLIDGAGEFVSAC